MALASGNSYGNNRNSNFISAMEGIQFFTLCTNFILPLDKLLAEPLGKIINYKVHSFRCSRCNG